MQNQTGKNFIRQRQMRTETLTALLDCIADGCATKRRIQAKTGFSWGSVSSYIALLEEAGAIVPAPREERDAEDPRSVRYRIAPDRRLCLGLEVRNCSIEAVLGTADGRIAASYSHQAASELTNATLAEETANAIRSALDRAGIGPDAVAGAVFALTGAVDVQRKIWLRSPHNPGISGFDFSTLHDLWPESWEVVLEHDILSKARSVIQSRGLSNDDSVFLHIGDGIGMAVRRGGAFQTGSRGFAGEIGHIPCRALAGEKSRRCSCGKSDCMETRLSTRVSADVRTLERHLLDLCVTAVNLCDPATLIVGGEAVEAYLAQHEAEFLRKLRKASWMEAPANFCFYRMSECLPAWGAVLGRKEFLIRTIAAAEE